MGQSEVPLFTMNSAKQAWIARDLDRQAAAAGFELRWNPHFPLHTTQALRMALLSDPNSVCGRAFVHRMIRGAWSDGKDLRDSTVLTAWANEVGLDGPS